MDRYKGQKLDNRYMLLRRIGEGNFGMVYEANHLAAGNVLRKVAVKIMKNTLSEEQAKEFFSEPIMLVNLTDRCQDSKVREHFVTIHDAVRCDDEGPLKGRPLLVMEYIKTGSLANKLAAGPFPLKRAVNYMGQMLDALSFMHQGYLNEKNEHCAIAHRDLKPDNILIKIYNRNTKSAFEVLKISDFGLAIELDDFLGWSEAAGTIQYQSPEMLSIGRSAGVSSDVYSLGLIFYEMIAGNSPFAEVGSHISKSGSEQMTEFRGLQLRAREREQFNALERHEELSGKPQLVEVIRKSLEFHEQDRYRDARQFLADFNEATGSAQDKLQQKYKPQKTPREEVKRLIQKARQFQSLDDIDSALKYAADAHEINNDRNRIPDKQVIGESYELMVELEIKQNNFDEAGRIALEGYSRKRCHGTCRAMGLYYKAMSSSAAEPFFNEAKTHAAEV